MLYSILGVVALTATTVVSSADAGLATYSLDLAQDTAVLGDVVSVDVYLSMDPLGLPFTGLSVAAFDIDVADPLGATGTLDNTSPGLGLAPSWSILGNPGSISGDDILGIEAGQFPPTNLNTSVLLYSFDYTVVDGSTRDIDFSAAWAAPVLVFGSSIFDVQPYVTGGETTTLSVVPAPGAAALLGLAGLAVRRRRRA